MNVKQTIINMILQYPLLYKDTTFEHSRDKVLDHLFFTNGNGFDWVNGELICNGLKTDTLEIPDGYFSTPLLSTEADESDMAKRFRKEFNKPFVPREICSKEAMSIYPICQYAAIANLPADIKPDWFDAAYEACYMAMDYFTDPYKHCRDVYIREWVVSRDYDKIKEHLEKQIHFISVAIMELSKIKNGWYNAS